MFSVSCRSFKMYSIVVVMSLSEKTCAADQSVMKSFLRSVFDLNFGEHVPANGQAPSQLGFIIYHVAVTIVISCSPYYAPGTVIDVYVVPAMVL